MAMYACVFCRTVVAHLHSSSLSNAAGGGNSKNNNSSIRVTLCPRCDAAADPYVEQEMLLVVLDILLLRPAAARHLVLHRWSSPQRNNWHNAARWMGAASMMQSQVWWETSWTHRVEDVRSAAHFATLLIFVMGLNAMQGLAMALILLDGKHRSLRATHVYWLTLVPMAGHGAILLLQFWEPDDDDRATVEHLGLGLILLYQAFLVLAVCNSLLRGTIALVLGVAVRLVLATIVTSPAVQAITLTSSSTWLPMCPAINTMTIEGYQVCIV